MKVAIDARVLETSTGSRGIGYYTSNIIKNLIKAPKKFDLIFYVTFPGPKNKGIQIWEQEFYSIPTLYRPRKLVRYFDKIASLFWKFSLIKLKPDILHITHLFEWYYLSVPLNIKTVIGIYDLIPLIYKEIYFKDEKVEKWYVKRLEQINSADKIITISESSKKDLEKLLKIPSEKIQVIYCGVDKKFKKTDELLVRNKLRSNYKITKPFVLAISTYAYHKNTSRIFRAFKEYIEKNKNKDLLLIVVCKLILMERRGWEKEVRKLGIDDRVIFTNFVPDEDMPYFYNGAEVLFFPSIYEGFGLPIAEAMACGTPVITSNTSSMPEVGGEAAYYVNPLRIESMTEGLKKVLNDHRLRKNMIKKGFIQARKFSWEKAAKKTLKVYSSILSSN